MTGLRACRAPRACSIATPRGFERVRAAYPWQPDTFVSGHNDPNQFNVLYDGDRLWLIDWETAYRNDPYVDLATLCSALAPTPAPRSLRRR